MANVAALGWLPGTSVTPACAGVDGPGGPLRAGAALTSEGTGVCAGSPSPPRQFAYLGHRIPQALFALGALVLLLRFLRTAAQEGPYTSTVPGRLSALGWFVLIGGTVSALLFALSQHFVRNSLLVGVPSWDWLTRWGGAFPRWSIATGAAALTFAHILRIGVRMREDLEGAI